VGLKRGTDAADPACVEKQDWQGFSLNALEEHLRANANGPDAEKMIWAFERALSVARVDEDLLGYLLAATACLVARSEDSTPRGVFDAFFRRSVSDDAWREHYRSLLTQ
jgi:hypothetical protein